MGEYKLQELWTFTVQMYFICILALCLGAVIIFPM
jgi:hypothetical protein